MLNASIAVNVWNIWYDGEQRQLVKQDVKYVNTRFGKKQTKLSSHKILKDFY